MLQYVQIKNGKETNIKFFLPSFITFKCLRKLSNRIHDHIVYNYVWQMIMIKILSISFEIQLDILF